MKNVLIATALLLLMAWPALADGPFSVGGTPNEPNWTSWGYEVDYQTWANWFAVTVPWGTDAGMSGNYVINQDLLFRVDPSTSGLADPSSVYGANFWNHDSVYGLGEFFDAGDALSDKNYYLALSLGDTDTWAVWYDADRDLVDDGGSEHPIFGGAVTNYWNQDGYFYGVLQADPAVYDGDFSPSHTEGAPNLMNAVFHAGNTGEPVPEPGTLALLAFAGLSALAAMRFRWR